MPYIENFDCLLVGIFKSVIVVINDKSMKNGIQCKFVCLFQNDQNPCCILPVRSVNCKPKMAAIEILNFAYYFDLSAYKLVRHVFSDIFMVFVKISRNPKLGF